MKALSLCAIWLCLWEGALVLHPVYAIRIAPKASSRPLNNKQNTPIADVHLFPQGEEGEVPIHLGRGEGVDDALGVDTPHSYLQSLDGAKLIRRARRALRNTKNDLRRRHSLLRKMKEIARAVESRLGLNTALVSVQENVRGETFVGPKGKSYTVAYAFSFRPFWLYAQVRNVKGQGYTIRFPISTYEPAEASIEDARKDSIDAEGQRRHLPRAMRRHTVAVNGQGRLEGPPERLFVVQLLESAVLNVAEVMEPLIACLVEMPLDSLGREDRIYLTTQAANIARQAVASKVFFPRANDWSFFITKNARVKFADTRGSITSRNTAKFQEQLDTLGAEPYQRMARALAGVIYRLWCEPMGGRQAAATAAAAAGGETTGGQTVEPNPPSEAMLEIPQGEPATLETQDIGDHPPPMPIQQQASSPLAIEEETSPQQQPLLQLEGVQQQQQGQQTSSALMEEISLEDESLEGTEKPLMLEACRDPEVLTTIRALQAGRGSTNAIREAFKLFRAK